MVIIMSWIWYVRVGFSAFCMGLVCLRKRMHLCCKFTINLAILQVNIAGGRPANKLAGTDYGRPYKLGVSIERSFLQMNYRSMMAPLRIR